MIYPLTSVDKLKEFVKSDASKTTLDKLFQDLINRATAAIERETKRKLRGRPYTHFFSGDGMSGELFLKEYPIIGTTADVDLYDDTERDFESTSKFADDDFVIFPDEGIFELLQDSSLGSVFSKGIQNIKAVYTAGYDEFEVVSGFNDAIDFNEGGAEINSTLDEGTYTGVELATEIDTQLTADGAGAYTVAYNRITGKFTIVKSAGTFSILWSSGTNTLISAFDLLGFLNSADDTAVLTYTSDNGRFGVPDDLQDACIFLAYSKYQKSKQGSENIFGKKSIQTANPSAGTLSFITDTLPPEIVDTILLYKRHNL